MQTITDDLDNDGKQDIILNGWATDYNSRTDSGSVYVIYNTLLDNYSGTGNNIDLADSSSYNLRFDGAGSGDGDDMLGDIALTTGDLDNDGKSDLIMGGPHGDGGASENKTNSGFFYVVPNSLIDNYSGTGNNIDLANSSNYSLKYDGGTAYDHLAIWNIKPTDLNNDGIKDLVFTAHLTDYNSRTDSGSLYIIYNFPHSFSVSSLANNIRSDQVTVTGTVTASNSVTKITQVQYSLDNTNNSLSGNWKGCTADDGSFDSLSENFTCTIPSSSLTEKAHHLYLRAYDANTSYTASAGMPILSFTYDRSSPKISWTNTAKAKRTFSAQQSIDHLYTTNNRPTFTFTKASDAASGILKYQIIIKGQDNDQERIYIDDIDPKAPTDNPNINNIREDGQRWISYDLNQDTITVYSKKKEGELANGAYRWKVRALDKAGNSADTEEKTLLINTHQARFSQTFLPLSLLNIGRRKTNITSLDPKTVPASPLTISTPRPPSTASPTRRRW
jgi:hypothetical protein